MNNSKRIRGVGKTLLTLLMAISFILPALTVFGTESPEATTPTGIPFSQVGNYIDQLVADHMEQYTPGMAIAIVHDGEIVFSRGYGYTDLTRQTP
ncbi:MAG: beta-lactamase family protein, partial [Defluviitaleaceae bacterium]|nr:beta-lactamase family protein [Defluviitaleaceae bacterium]